MSKKLPVWETDNYYQQAKQASLKLDHPGLQQIKHHIKDGQKVLEVGCGEGTKLNLITQNHATGYGVDLSTKAISIGNNQYPHLNFQQADAESLPFKSQTFDIVYSAFMLEHTHKPERVISEMIRVLKKSGQLYLITPNFGAPMRRSPCYQGSRLLRAATGIARDFRYYFQTNSLKKLDWQKVQPIASKQSYQIDWDTTVEPYIIPLLSFLRNKGLRIGHQSTCWKISEQNETYFNKTFRYLGSAGIYPFKYWGPHVFVRAEK